MFRGREQQTPPGKARANNVNRMNTAYQKRQHLSPGARVSVGNYGNRRATADVKQEPFKNASVADRGWAR